MRRSARSSHPLTVLDESTAFTTVRFSDRSKFGAARIWLPDASAFPPATRNGWNLVVRLHGGNGNNQGDIDPDSPFLLALLNDLGCVVVSINWQDNGFYEPNGQDPRALFFPDGLLEPAMIVPWLVARRADAELFGAGGSITDDPNRIALFGMSDGAWRAALLAYLESGEFGLAAAVEQLLGTPYVQPNFLIASQGHFDVEHFWMTEAPTSGTKWTTSSAAPLGSTTLALAGGTGRWKTGDQLVIALPSEKGFEYLVTGAAGNVVTVWPAVRALVPANTSIQPIYSALIKYSQGGYSWLGAPLFRAGGTTTWANFPTSEKKAASLWPRIRAANPRVALVRAALLYPPAEPFVTNDDDAVSGWATWLESPGANPRYQHLHSEANAFALAGLLASLGQSQGTSAADGFLLRAGGVRSNPLEPSTRFANAGGQVTDALLTFLANHGW